MLADLAREGCLHRRRLLGPRAQREKLLVTRNVNAEPVGDLAHLCQLLRESARSLDADGVGIVERLAELHEAGGSLEQLAGHLAGLRLRLDRAQINDTLVCRLERRIERGKLARMLRERGMNFVHALAMLVIAGESAESNRIALGRELFSLGDMLCAFGLKLVDKSQSLFKFTGHKFSLPSVQPPLGRELRKRAPVRLDQHIDRRRALGLIRLVLKDAADGHRDSL